MGADGAGCHLHQHSTGGHLYESAGLFRPADVHREDPVTAHFGRGDRVFAQSAGQFCGLPPRAAPAKEAQGPDGEESQPRGRHRDGTDRGGISGVWVLCDAAAAAL